MEKGECAGGSLMTVSTELSKYGLDLVGVQEVRWESSGPPINELLNSVWNKKELSYHRTEPNIVTIHKKGDKTDL
jgi:hypothetical protein